MLDSSSYPCLDLFLYHIYVPFVGPVAPNVSLAGTMSSPEGGIINKPLEPLCASQFSSTG